LGKDLRKVKKILKFLFLPFGYLRVWPKKLTSKAQKHEEILAISPKNVTGHL